MIDIYEQHRQAFAQVSAYVVMRGDDRVATVAIKFPRDGAGRLYAYVHWIGAEMTRGFAGGGGYDKRTAACASAARKLSIPADMRDAEGAAAFKAALLVDDGNDSSEHLRRAGFTVWQAV